MASPSATSTPYAVVNGTLPQAEFNLVVQNVMCAYPISDIYAPTPRFLYYSLLVLTFATIRYRWLTHTFLGAVVAYAASAAIHAFIIAANPSTVPPAQNVTVPVVPSNSNLTRVKSVITDTSTITVITDAVELDIDPITAVVVTAYLIGLPLQLWSRTMRSSRIIRYMILVWNLCMLAGTICALVSWPTTNLVAPQYRFCFADFLDPESINSDGWDASNWRGDFNSTISGIFKNPTTVWQSLSNNCYYPCFNTSQVIRQQTSLKAVVATPDTMFAKLHNPNRYGTDEFRGLVYASIICFSAMSVFLYVVSNFKLGSEALRGMISEPMKAWEKRQRVMAQLKRDAARSKTAWKGLWVTSIQPTLPSSKPSRAPSRSYADMKDDDPPDTPTSRVSVKPTIGDLLTPFRLIIDVLSIITMVIGLTLCPVVVVAFICWIEWYIRNDGATNETISQVGQWSPLVSVTVIFFATVTYRLHRRLASKEELQSDIRELEVKIRVLKGELERRGENTEDGDAIELQRRRRPSIANL